MGVWAAGAAGAWLAMQAAPTTEIAYAPQPAPARGAGICPGGLCQAEALDGVFEALLATEQGNRDRPVHILQIGDSHTAGDRITGALRARLQARFGASGRGVLPPGVPYAGYAPYQLQVTQTDWPAPTAPLLGGTPQPAFRTGLAGSRALVFGDASLTLVADPGAEFDVVAFCGDGGPDAGRLAVQTPDGDRLADFRSASEETVCLREALEHPVDRAVLRPLGAVSLHDIRLERSRPGVMVSNLGVVGAGLRDLAVRDEAIAAAELAAWRPALIVLAYGVNDGFDDGLDAAAYEALLRRQIERMRRLAPAASLMILGAPEGLKAGQGGPCGGRVIPPSLAVVRDVQRRVAAETDVAFWDWQGRMGGDCSAERLATMAEPYMRPDRVHFTSVGADWIGGVLSDDLTAAYDRWKARREGAD